MRRFKQTTTTHLVLEALTRADDFRTARQLQEETGRNNNQVSAALSLLRRYKAVEAMAVEGTLWWYATPENDTRSRRIEEKAPELKKRKPRKRKEVKK